MKKILCSSALSLGLAACSSMPSAYNGVTGFQVLQQDASSAELRYTLAARNNQTVDTAKLQAACQKVLGGHKTYQIDILNVQEIVNPRKEDTKYGVTVPKTKAIFALSNTPSLNNSQDMATRQALDTQPSSLTAVVYRCH